MDMSKEFFKALFQARNEIKEVVKNQKNEFSKSKYLDLAGLLEAIKEPLFNNKLMLLHKIEVEPIFGLRTTLLHDSQESLEVFYPFSCSLGSKDQEKGACITYARRYSILCLMSVFPAEDDDGNSNKKTPPNIYAINYPEISKKGAILRKEGFLEQCLEKLNIKSLREIDTEEKLDKFRDRYNSWKSAHDQKVQGLKVNLEEEAFSNPDLRDKLDLEKLREINSLSELRAFSNEIKNHLRGKDDGNGY